MNAVKNPTLDTLIDYIALRICAESGHEFSERFRVRVELKLKRRTAELGLLGFPDYLSYFHLHEKAELKQLQFVLTTGATQFFGEFSHFEYLSEYLLRTQIPILRKRADKTLHIWSTACSCGPEVYSLAMFFKHALALYDEEFLVKVTGTDSDSEALKIAGAGVFPRSEFRGVPLEYLGNDWERVSHNGIDTMRVKHSLRKLVHFEYANLLGLKARFPNQKFDLIFTRNVFSYFNESQIKESTLELLSHLQFHGRLFIGLSESLANLGLPVESCGPSIYAFTGNSDEKVQLINEELIKVFCVDDSPAVQALVRNILTNEAGFTITGSASNMNEVMKQTHLIRDADLVIFHLQNLQSKDDGSFGYIEQNFDKTHPPILMVAPETKDHSKLIRVAAKMGHFEFVEKPILNHLSEQGEAIRAKLRTLLLNRRNNVVLFRGADQYKKAAKVTQCGTKVRALVAGMSHLQKVANYLVDLKEEQPPIYLFFENMSSHLSALAHEIQLMSGRRCEAIQDLTTRAKPGEIKVCDFKKIFPKAVALHAGDRASIGLLGDLGAVSCKQILEWKGAQLILEDLGLGEAAQSLKNKDSEIFAASSFAFLSSEYLG